MVVHLLFRVVEESQCSCLAKSSKAEDPDDSDEDSVSQGSEDEVDHNQRMVKIGSRNLRISLEPAIASEKSFGEDSNSSVAQVRRNSIVALESGTMQDARAADSSNDLLVARENINEVRITCHSFANSGMQREINTAAYCETNVVNGLDKEIINGSGPYLVEINSNGQEGNNNGPSILSRPTAEIDKGKECSSAQGKTLSSPYKEKRVENISSGESNSQNRDLQLCDNKHKTNNSSLPIGNHSQKISNESNWERKKKKGTMKTAKWRKEKKKWANFVRGLNEESVEADTERGKEAEQPGDEDLTSKIIRDEALKTWRLGMQLGISGYGREQVFVDKLIRIGKEDRIACGQDK